MTDTFSHVEFIEGFAADVYVDKCGTQVLINHKSTEQKFSVLAHDKDAETARLKFKQMMFYAIEDTKFDWNETIQSNRYRSDVLNYNIATDSNRYFYIPSNPKRIEKP